MIELKNITKYFANIRALNNLSFSVGHSEVLGFLGPNGAGKSTTMKIISGFLRPTRGEVVIFGRDIASAPLICKRMMGYLPEGAPAYEDMTPQSYLRFIAAIRGLKGTTGAAALDAVVQQLELGRVLHQPIETLSKGFRRRVGLAQALIHDPRILILDEPTDGLDPNQKHQVRTLIRNLSRDKIVIISTHILEEVSAVCSRAIIVAKGELQFDGTPRELEARSRYHGATVLELQQAMDIGDTLRGLAAVAAVETEIHQQRFILFSGNAEAGGETLVAVWQLAQKHGWPLRALYTERGRMDEVFRTITDI